MRLVDPAFKTKKVKWDILLAFLIWKMILISTSVRFIGNLNSNTSEMMIHNNIMFDVFYVKTLITSDQQLRLNLIFCSLLKKSIWKNHSWLSTQRIAINKICSGNKRLIIKQIYCAQWNESGKRYTYINDCILIIIL